MLEPAAGRPVSPDQARRLALQRTPLPTLADQLAATAAADPPSAALLAADRCQLAVRMGDLSTAAAISATVATQPPTPTGIAAIAAGCTAWCALGQGRVPDALVAWRRQWVTAHADGCMLLALQGLEQELALRLQQRLLDDVPALVAQYQTWGTLLADPISPCRVLGYAGLRHTAAQDWAAATQAFTRQQEQARSAGLRDEEGMALGGLSLAAEGRGDYATAMAAAQAQRALAQARGDRRLEGQAISSLAFNMVLRGDTAAAQRLYDTRHAQALQDGDQAAAALAQWNQGVLLLRAGAQHQALPLLRAAVDNLTALDHPATTVYAAQLTELISRWAAPGVVPRLLDWWRRRRS